jgi:molybdopterin-guanine dinucleotide biosynthesis protein A
LALTAVVLAGGKPDDVSALAPGAPNKAFVPIGGRTLVARTLDALRTVPEIERIVVVAPVQAHGDAALAAADEARPDGLRITDSLRAGLDGTPPDDLVLVATSDLPILTRAAIEDFLQRARASQSDLVYSCVERRVHEAKFPGVPHTWAALRDGTYCGGGLVAMRPRAFPALERFLERLGSARKNPLALANIFGWDVALRYVLRLLTVRAAERRASQLLGVPVAAAPCAYAEVGVNVDRVSDVELAEGLVRSQSTE